MSPTGPPDKVVFVNDAGLTDQQIADALTAQYNNGATGPWVSKPKSDGSTTYFLAAYGD